MRDLSLAWLFMVTSLAGCSINSIQQDQPLLLGKGEGLAAIVMNTKDPITEVFVRPAGEGGDSLEIPSVPVGRSLYLFQVKAGHYCFQQFHYGDILFFGRGADVACFEVPAGQVGYSGDLAPLAENGRVVIHQDYDFDSFRALLNQEYPHIAAQFQLSPAAPLPLPAPGSTQSVPVSQPAPVDKPHCDKRQQLCAWAETAKGSRSQSIFLKNNTQWPIRIMAFQLYDCVNVKQACSVSRIDLRLPPHAGKKVMVVDPSDPDGAYTYQFRYEYGFDLSGHHR